MKSNKQMSPMKLVTMGLFTAVVCVVTMSFSIYVPATRGYFNIGDSMVFLTALLFGPIIGAFAGGVGAGLADLFLGYSYYAPATLVIKGFEGFIVGWLSCKKPALSQENWKIYTIILGIVVSGLLGYFGINYYSGDIEIALGSNYFTLNIPSVFWIGLSILIFAFIAWLGWKNDPEIGWTILSTVIGGSSMVLGYFLYQFFIIGPLFQIEVVAIAELPINVGQMIVGIVITIPMIKSIKRYLPFLDKIS
jgi:uncharacterized membrane protein